MQLYFIRHGQSENNALWEQTQVVKSFIVDPKLTAVGHHQAELLADHLVQVSDNPDRQWDPQNINGYGITHVYTSLMPRAVEPGLKSPGD